VIIQRVSEIFDVYSSNKLWF